MVTSGSIATSVSASGTIAAPEASTLSWATTGTIQKIDVAVGQTVKAGDVLAELDSASLSADVIQGQADLLAAQKNLATVQAGPTADQIAAARLAVVQAEQVVTQTQRTLNADTTPNVAYYQDQFNRAQEAVSAAQSTVSNDQYQIALRTASDALANAKSNLEQWQILEQRYPGYSAMHGDGLANAQTKYDRAVQDFNVAQANVQNSSTNDANALADARAPDIAPALSGRYEVDGVAAVPVLELIVRRYAEETYSPAAAEKVCGIPAARIRALAQELASTALDSNLSLAQPWTDWAGRRHDRMQARPVAMHAMRGISAHSNGFQTCRAIHLLQLLVAGQQVVVELPELLGLLVDLLLQGAGPGPEFGPALLQPLGAVLDQLLEVGPDLLKFPDGLHQLARPLLDAVFEQPVLAFNLIP